MNKKKIRSYIRITTLIIIFPLITLLLYGGLSHLFFFYSKQNDAKKELIKYEKILMDSEKNNLIVKVENLTRFIRYYNYKSSDKIKNEVKSTIVIAANIANNIYSKYHNTMNREKLQDLIITAMSNINTPDSSEYIFMLDMNGIVYVHPDQELIGANAMDLRDVNGKFIIKEFVSVLEEYREGFIDYYWYMPEGKKDMMYYKISFVKTLDMFDWYIGTGKYLKRMNKIVSQDMLQYITDNSFFEDGYFFVSNSKNKIIYHPENKTEDLDNFRIEGIYEDDEKIAYTSYVAENDWYITAVKELKGIKKNIDIQKLANEKQTTDNIKTNLYLLGMTWIISLLLSLYLSFIVNRMLRKYEARLRESNDKLIFQSRQALIGELFSMIAHQWRQPINKIASILVLLRFNLSNEKPDIEDMDSKFQDIEDSIEFMSDTIDDFRTFYKPKEGSEELPLSILIEKAIDFLEGNIRKKDIKIIKELDNIVHDVYSNEFLQVMINLIKNATDAVELRGIVKVKLYKNNNIIVVSVEDDGAGIDEKNVSKIFDPYFTTKSDSMGLGLYMCRLIIEKHLYGAIEAKRLDEGTRFVIKFYLQS